MNFCNHLPTKPFYLHSETVKASCYATLHLMKIILSRRQHYELLWYGSLVKWLYTNGKMCGWRIKGEKISFYLNFEKRKSLAAIIFPYEKGNFMLRMFFHSVKVVDRTYIPNHMKRNGEHVYNEALHSRIVVSVDSIKRKNDIE